MFSHLRQGLLCTQRSAHLLQKRYTTSGKGTDSKAKKSKLLFTPGPLSTADRVRTALFEELGSREPKFLEAVKNIRKKVLKVGGFSEEKDDVVIIQGCGTMSVEAVVSTVIPPTGKLLVIRDGAYGKRILDIATKHGISSVDLAFPEEGEIDVAKVKDTLLRNDTITHVSVVHCETTTGKLNPVKKIAQVIQDLPRKTKPYFFVDAMSSFGGVEFDFQQNLDFMVTSANKCIEGVPGFGLIIAKKESMKKCAGHAKTLSLDFIAQWTSMEETGQFRFTPPTHVLLGFNEALNALEEEGGITARVKRYKQNQQTLLKGMHDLGFKTLLPPNLQSHIITSFLYPEHKNWNWDQFYNKLYQQGFVLYPGKLTNRNCFRIGTIGHIFPQDVERLLVAISSVKKEMGF